MHMLYFPPWPRVDLSRMPGVPPVTFMLIRRTARPMVELALAPGRKTLTPELISSSLAIGPFTTISWAELPVLAWLPW